MWRKFSFLIISLFAIVFKTIGQHENTLHFMQSIPQSVYNNPAFVPNYKASIGLPGISSTYLGFAYTGFSYKGIESTINDSTINLNKFYDLLKKKNLVKVALGTDLFSFGFKVNPRIHLTFNVTEKVYMRFMFPKELLWLIPGNTPGGTVQMAPEFDAMHYREFGLGASFKVDQKLTLGAKVKALYGKSNINTEKADLSLTTDAVNYGMTLKGDVAINTSGFNKIKSEENDSLDFFDGIKDYILNKNNKGFAIDLGATYKVMDRLTLGLSILDLGSIKWKDDVKNYKLDKSVSYSFDGFDLNNSKQFDNVEDSIRADLDIKETSSAYKAKIPTRFYFSANYLLRRNCYLGLIFMGEIYQKKFSPSISASFTKDFGRRLSWGLTYTAANGSSSQIGTGLSIKLFPVQLYLLSDNILGAALSPKSVQDVSFRFGMNLIFGRVKTEERQSYK